MRRRGPGDGHDRRAPELTDRVLLIAGLGQGPWAWRWVLPLLRHEARIFTARGTGELAHLPARRSVAEMADDVAEVLDGRPAHLAGLSMGGYISLTLALGRPDLVRSLFLVCTGAGGPDRVPRPRHVREAYEAAAVLPLGDYERATQPLSLAPGWPEAHPARYEDILAARIGDGAPMETMWAHVEACLGYYAAGIPVERIQTRAYVLHGIEDLVVPPENGRMLAARLPNAVHEEVEGGGHNLPLERPEELAQRIDAWVSDASL